MFYVVEESGGEGCSPEQYQVEANSPEDAVRIFLINNSDVNLRDAGNGAGRHGRALYEGWKKFVIHVNPIPEERNEDWYTLITEY
tara:strand:+ start:15526 stop:15780 length:255 start_codon:yes stop_codon:yes gene_type:complete